MHRFISLLVAISARREPRGQTLVEYGVLLSLIAVVSIAALLFVGPAVSDMFSNVALNLEGA